MNDIASDRERRRGRRLPGGGPTARALVTAMGLTALGGCAEAGKPGESGPTFQIEVAPLTLTGVTDAEYDLRVYNSDTVFDQTTLVWSQEGITSVTYGDGKGAITYIGPCDADVQTDNTVELVTVSFTGDGTFQLPCPASDPCRISKPCEENADTLVEFNLTVMRNAKQGFFDIAVNFEDIFCSAKLDCLDDGLLHDLSGQRKDTVVIGLACTSGPGADGSTLLFDDLTLTCQDDPVFTETIVTEPSETAGDGNQITPPLSADSASVAVFQVGIYQGAEQLDCGVDENSQPISCQKIYSNTAIGLGARALGSTCTITGKATAGPGDFSSPTPGYSAYPIIAIDVEVTDGAGLSCGQNPLNGESCTDTPPSGVCTGYTDPAVATGESFAHHYPTGVASAGTCSGSASRLANCGSGSDWADAYAEGFADGSAAMYCAWDFQNVGCCADDDGRGGDTCYGGDLCSEQCSDTDAAYLEGYYDGFDTTTFTDGSSCAVFDCGNP